MKHFFCNDGLAPCDVHHHGERLLQIANLDPDRVAEGRILRAELRNMLIVARALAIIVELVFLQVWDRTFQIVGTRVFMQFSSGDLLATGRTPVTDILEVLKFFLAWRDARLTLCVPVMDVSQPVLEGPVNDQAIKLARRTLALLRATRAGEANTNFDEIFTRWMQRCARVDEFDIMAGKVDGEVVRLRLPHKARILGPLSLPTQSCSDPSSSTFEVMAVRPMRLVSTTSGIQLLIPRNDECESPSPGTSIAYTIRDRRLVKRWQVLA